MDVTGLFHAPGTPPLIPTDEDWWTPQPVWAVWRNIILWMWSVTTKRSFSIRRARCNKQNKGKIKYAIKQCGRKKQWLQPVICLWNKWNLKTDDEPVYKTGLLYWNTLSVLSFSFLTQSTLGYLRRIFFLYVSTANTEKQQIISLYFLKWRKLFLLSVKRC